jgi:uncharacterized damage-inducible protein DinB
VSEPLSSLIAAANAVTQETQARFGHLTTQQLNWKPDASQWSIAQCLAHLVAASESYFPTFEQVLRGEKKSSLWERLPWLPALMGKLLIQAVAPETTRKLRAPKIIEPANSSIDEAIIRRFIDRQEQVIKYMKATEELDLEKIIITSPVTRFITYSLMDAYRFIVTHEKRHLLQATRVLAMEGFPKFERVV